MAPYLAKDIDKIERVQRRATNLVPEIKELSYEERLKSLDLFTLAHRRTRGDMISMYKIMSGLYDIEPTDFFKPNVTKTRGHKFKLYFYHIKHRNQKKLLHTESNSSLE